MLRLTIVLSVGFMSYGMQQESSRNYFDEFANQMQLLLPMAQPNPQSVHLLDPWVGENINSYFMQANKTLPWLQIPLTYIADNKDFSKELFSLYAFDQNAKESMEHMWNVWKNQGKVRQLLVGLYSLGKHNKNALENLNIQASDAKGLCLQGQTNRLLMALHFGIQTVMWEGDL
jgi:hypothetical protein